MVTRPRAKWAWRIRSKKRGNEAKNQIHFTPDTENRDNPSRDIRRGGCCFEFHPASGVQSILRHYLRLVAVVIIPQSPQLSLHHSSRRGWFLVSLVYSAAQPVSTKALHQFLFAC